VADRAPDAKSGKPEAGIDALLDELVRAHARQIAERDYECLQKRARRRKGGRRDAE
jgi:hypothetical protein